MISEWLGVILNLPKLANISPPEQEVLKEDVPDGAVVEIVVLDYLFDGLLVDGVVVDNSHPLDHINHRQVTTPDLPIARNRMLVNFNLYFLVAGGKVCRNFL